MGKKLAIQGHSTHGTEIIKLLEMMGGYCPAEMYGLCENRCYSIKDNGWVGWDYIGPEEIDKYTIFTLEEFLEKYPFKVGDFVGIPEYESEVRICEIQWDGFEIQYKIYRNDDEEWYTASELLEYNDNPMDCCTNNMIKSLDDVYSIAKCKTTGQGTYAIKIAEGYKFDSIDENGNIIVKSIKPTYPKTYKECCDVLGIPPYYNLRYHTYEPNYDEYATTNELCSLQDKLNILGKLLICCKAYWKIAGEELGLDKSWESPLPSLFETVYCIRRKNNEIIKGSYRGGKSEILEFPTEEIRDVFYENFKDLIERCKELL